jgi:hypothetical protein
MEIRKTVSRIILVFAIAVFCLANGQEIVTAQASRDLYTLDAAIAKGVVNTRMSLFNATDQKHIFRIECVR